MNAHRLSAEKQRLAEDREGKASWRRWGPYVSDRQWGTVREDYSSDGNAWSYLPHDHARSRAYRWGEDGIAGICDEHQRLCVALALWNGQDPILKERFFGLTNEEGNHGEDVKELYWHLDAAPSHAYLKMLYKYPQHAFPYAKLVEENRGRGRHEPEFELIDTDLFEDDRYFDVVVEYAKASVDDILMQITVHNRGPEDAVLHVVPQLWFRNTWSWKPGSPKPHLSLGDRGEVIARHATLGEYRFYVEDRPRLLFCDNESNGQRLFGSNGAPGHWKDAFHDRIVHGRTDAVNPEQTGTKAAAWREVTIPAKGSTRLRFRLAKGGDIDPFGSFDGILEQRQRETDEFYAELQADIDDADVRRVQRQAFAGMIWSKQFYYFDVREWLKGDPGQPKPPESRRHLRNCDWDHLNNADIISMPDKWEYPWYAAWDLAFHCIPLAQIDADFAKRQLVLLTREWYMHPNGQLPAYEWNFGDVNPPVHAWATWRVFQIDRKQRGDCGDLAFLERVFHKLMLNFTWWVNRKDAQGRNIFQGGFLGLDNIGVFDRSRPLPTGGFINQADGTSWMAMYCLNLLRIAIELATHNRVYEDVATKFFEHFLHIAEAMTKVGGNGRGVGLWDDQDEFYYDELILPNGDMHKLRVRSMVGLIPLFAVETIEPETLEKLPEFRRRLRWFLKYRPDLAQLVSRWEEPGRGERRLLSLLRGHRMKCLLRRMLDETEFLSDYGVRAVSRHHSADPYCFWTGGVEHQVRYESGESSSGLFGGNSNWRGPIWFPVNYLLIESLQRFHHYYGYDFKVECPTGSGKYLTLLEIANELTCRLSRIFLCDEHGRRPVNGTNDKLQRDPHFRDLIHFYEYFDGDTGRGVGASHQTGWTGLIAKLLQPRRPESAEHCNHQAPARIEAAVPHR
jgi:hypothetical protein